MTGAFLADGPVCCKRRGTGVRTALPGQTANGGMAETWTGGNEFAPC